MSVAPLLRRSLRTREMTMSEASKQPSTRYPVFGENTFSQLLMKSYSATFPMRGENFGDRLFASWHSAASFVCGKDYIGVLLRKFYKSAFLVFGKSGAKITVATTHRAAALMRGEDRCHCPNKAADPAVSSCAWGRRIEGGLFILFQRGILLRVGKTLPKVWFVFPSQRFPFQRLSPCIARSYEISTGV